MNDNLVLSNYIFLLNYMNIYIYIEKEKTSESYPKEDSRQNNESKWVFLGCDVCVRMLKGEEFTLEFRRPAVNPPRLVRVSALKLDKLPFYDDTSEFLFVFDDSTLRYLGYCARAFE